MEIILLVLKTSGSFNEKIGEKEFKKKMKHYKFLKEVIKFVEQDLKTFRV
jgi:hypothetical protein